MFSIDGKLWRFLSKMADLILVNIIFIIFSIPVITIGASKAALYDVSRRIRRDEEGAILKNFFFKTTLTCPETLKPYSVWNN